MLAISSLRRVSYSALYHLRASRRTVDTRSVVYNCKKKEIEEWKMKFLLREQQMIGTPCTTSNILNSRFVVNHVTESLQTWMHTIVRV